MSSIAQRPVASIMVEGNVGAGKSTFLKIINDALDVQIVYEPHTKWQNVGGTNLLDCFYKETNRWAYTFQSYAFVTRVLETENFAKKHPNTTLIVERSVYSDRYCFARGCFEQGTMNALEWKLYQEWFAWLVGNYTQKPQGFIYLQTDPTVCYERMKKRNRTEESAVSLDYLTTLHKKHEDWLVKKIDIDSFIADVPVLVLECNNDFENNVAEQEKHLEKISDFFSIARLNQGQNIKNLRLSL